MKKRLIVVIDTSMLTVHLRIPGHEDCGMSTDRWTFERVEKHLKARTADGALLVLPLATIIETARHIAFAPSRRHELAKELARRVKQSVDGTSPWQPFAHQGAMWDGQGLGLLMERWPALAAGRISLADASISDVADFYAKLGHSVEILTGDNGLKSLEPITPSRTPRRRR